MLQLSSREEMYIDPWGSDWKPGRTLPGFPDGTIIGNAKSRARFIREEPYLVGLPGDVRNLVKQRAREYCMSESAYLAFLVRRDASAGEGLKPVNMAAFAPKRRRWLTGDDGDYDEEYDLPMPDDDGENLAGTW